MSFYKGKALGTLSDFGCYSFHETKNFSMGEGGALLIHNDVQFEQAEIMREKGTNRSKFFRNQIDKYSWVDWGSSYLPSELNAAYLWSQLEYADDINDDRMRSWDRYYELLSPLLHKGLIELPFIPEECTHNAHIFYIKPSDLKERSRLLSHLAERGVGAVYHYVPLHTSKAGERFGTFFGEDRYTTKESNRLIRLPMYYRIGADAIDYVVKEIFSFYGEGFIDQRNENLRISTFFPSNEDKIESAL
jgi:dTDP-4-amino-4,6-dideoxygalactose transaminase